MLTQLEPAFSDCLKKNHPKTAKMIFNFFFLLLHIKGPGVFVLLMTLQRNFFIALILGIKVIMVKPNLHWAAYCHLSQAADTPFSSHHLFNFLQDQLIQHFNNLSISRCADPSDLSRAEPSTAKKVYVSRIFLIFVRWLQWLDFNLSDWFTFL